MRMRGSRHPRTEGPIEYNSTPTRPPGGPGLGFQAETLRPLTSSVNSGIQRLGLCGAVTGGQTEGPASCGDSRRLTVPRVCMYCPPDSPGGPEGTVSRGDITDPNGREEVRAWVRCPGSGQQSEGTSCARSQGYTLRGALGGRPGHPGLQCSQTLGSLARLCE